MYDFVLPAVTFLNRAMLKEEINVSEFLLVLSLPIYPTNGNFLAGSLVVPVQV